MARGSISLEDYLEDKIKSYMKINKIKTKNKAINEIISTFFEYEKVFKNIKDLDSKIDKLLSTVYLIKSLEEQSYANHGFRENSDPTKDKYLTSFYDNIKKNKYKIWD